MRSEYPEWVLKQKKSGTAIHRIGNNYYLYEITSKWDPRLKRAKKITKAYLGKVTKDGLEKPNLNKYIPSTVKEYAASSYLLADNQIVIDNLKKYFPSFYREIFILSALRFFHQCPLKNMKVHYQDSWLSEEMGDVRLSKDFLAHLLEVIGHQRESVVCFLKEFIDGCGKLLVDLTHVFSQSANMALTEKGYNSKLEFNPQVNLLFIFCQESKLPLFYRILPGNVRDVASLKATIEESGIKDIIIIADKGFYSESNVSLLENNDLRYVIPLKRNSTLTDFKILKEGTKDGFKGYFKFKDRFIFYYRCGSNIPVFVYLDDELRVREQKVSFTTSFEPLLQHL
jgi:transposase